MIVSEVGGVRGVGVMVVLAVEAEEMVKPFNKTKRMMNPFNKT